MTDRLSTDIVHEVISYEPMTRKRGSSVASAKHILAVRPSVHPSIPGTTAIADSLRCKMQWRVELGRAKLGDSASVTLRGNYTTKRGNHDRGLPPPYIHSHQKGHAVIKPAKSPN
uniref:Uncharacterized protein n=1 Tax=Oryza nivara TaxID=4536 RepID=A0A0E0GVC6_ORYNI